MTAPPKTRRKLDPERTRQDILAAAHDEFVEHGLAGARVDAIAARTNTVKRMIYYYFGSKEGLYRAVLEQAYAAIRSAEAALELDRLPPAEAIRRITEFTFDYHNANPGFVRLMTIENINQGRFVAETAARSINSAIVQTIAAILNRGVADGTFRPGLNPVDVHMMITALSFFRVANRHTFGLLFDEGLAAAAPRHRALMADTVLRAIKMD